MNVPSLSRKHIHTHTELTQEMPLILATLLKICLLPQLRGTGKTTYSFMSCHLGENKYINQTLLLTGPGYVCVS